MRDLTTQMQTGLQQRVVRPVLIGKLDIENDPVAAWTGHGLFAPSSSGDSELNGTTFDDAESFVSISDIKEDRGIGGPVTLTAMGHDLDEDLLRQVVRDKRAWRGKDAFLWLGLFDTDEVSVIADPVRIKTGVMTKMKVSRRDKNSVVEITIDADVRNANNAPFRWLDHTRIWSSDTLTTFMITLANKPGGLERSDIRQSFNYSDFGSGGNFSYPPKEYFARFYGK